MSGTDPSPTPERTDLLLLAALGFSGGFGDAGGYLLAGCFTGHVTGNAVLAAVSLADLDGATLTIRSLAILCFLAATTAGLLLARVPRVTLAFLLFAEAGSVLAAPLVAPGWPLIVCLCLTLGLQNGVFRTVAGVSVHTSYITGGTTKLLASLTRRGQAADEAGSSEDRRAIAAIATVWLGFLLGALLASFAVRWFGTRGLWLLGLPLLMAVLLEWRRGRSRS